MKFAQIITLVLAATLSLVAAEPARKPDTSDDSQAKLRDEIIRRAMIREFGDPNRTAKPHLPDDSQAHILKSDWLDLARELGDESEAGQDEAARLQAAAKRIETETRVASKSMRRVMVLEDWRGTLNRWDDLQIQLVWIGAEGGLMYYHMLFRNNAVNEDFLATLADNLPLTAKPLTKDTAIKIDALLKKAKERLAQFKAQTKRSGYQPPIPIGTLGQQLEETHAALKTQFQYAGDDAATQLLLDRCKDPTELWRER